MRDLPATDSCDRGGAKSDVWMQIIAECHPAARGGGGDPGGRGDGVALAVAVALVIFGDYKDIKKVVKIRKTFEPRAEPAGEYDGL